MKIFSFRVWMIVFACRASGCGCGIRRETFLSEYFLGVYCPDSGCILKTHDSTMKEIRFTKLRTDFLIPQIINNCVLHILHTYIYTDWS